MDISYTTDVYLTCYDKMTKHVLDYFHNSLPHTT